MKSNFRAAMAALLALVLLSIAGTALAAAPDVRKVEYDGSGKVEVKFGQKVRYAKKTSVLVKDAAGAAYEVKIRDKDDKELEFTVRGFKPATEYTFEIAGVYKRGTKNDGAKVAGEFAIPEAKKVVVEKAEYKGNGKVEIDFEGKVEYKNLKITAKNGGFSYKAKISKRESDELKLTFSGIAARPGVYDYTISGVRARKSGDAYGSVSGTFIVPEIKPVQVEKAEYDAKDHELDVDFVNDVEWKNPAVSITDAAGKKMRATINTRSSDKCRIHCQLVEGETYTLKISGIRAPGQSQYGKITYPFVARDD